MTTNILKDKAFPDDAAEYIRKMRYHILHDDCDHCRAILEKKEPGAQQQTPSHVKMSNPTPQDQLKSESIT